MHPTTARYLVEARHSDLRAEAARERLAREVRKGSRPKASAGATGLVAATRQWIAALLPSG